MHTFRKSFRIELPITRGAENTAYEERATNRGLHSLCHSATGNLLLTTSLLPQLRYHGVGKVQGLGAVSLIGS